jgi:hypothetical protein
MNAKIKIPLASIEQAHRTLDALPEHRPDELTKTQAIQRLIDPIRASQSKGYSLAAIGRVLSECGIPITTGALRAYVSEAKAGGLGKKKPKTKRAMRASKGTSGAAQTSPTVAPPQPTDAAPKPTIAKTARSNDLDWEPAPERDRAAPAPAGVRRSSFQVRPDTDDI